MPSPKLYLGRGGHVNGQHHTLGGEPERTNRQMRLNNSWVQSPRLYLSCGSRVDGQSHKLGGKPESAQLALDQFAVDAVEEGIVGSQPVEVRVDTAQAEQPRQCLVELPAPGS